MATQPAPRTAQPPMSNRAPSARNVNEISNLPLRCSWAVGPEGIYGWALPLQHGLSDASSAAPRFSGLDGHDPAAIVPHAVGIIQAHSRPELPVVSKIGRA